MQSRRTYVAIDLKSFYASVECVKRKLDPLSVNLVVADPTRTEKTICLAVSPALKSYGIPGRPRLFEVNEKVKEINSIRRRKAPGYSFKGKSYFDPELKRDPSLELNFIIAPPEMSEYMKVSNSIYEIYLKYIAPEDMHIYSVDEVFIDVTEYLGIYKMTAKELAMTMIKDVLLNTGITATAGIGPNLYLCKIAMDIEAKHTDPDKYGVRIAELDEISYRQKYWNHRPLTDFWRIGRGYETKLKNMGLYTMGDVARCSIDDEERLYKKFGVNAELLIDHAWGYEPVMISDIKAYKPDSSSLSSGQVLKCAYSNEKAKLVMREMTENLVLDLLSKNLVTDQMVLTVCYDTGNLRFTADYDGKVKADRYGRAVPKESHGSVNIGRYTSSLFLIDNAVCGLFDRITKPSLTVRRIYVIANHVIREPDIPEEPCEQLSLFSDFEAEEKRKAEEEKMLEKEKRKQQAVLSIKNKYGKNSILKGMNFKEGATAIERNGQVGGHKA